jgi:uncharacterized protein YceH (UPF0502 family)
MLRGAQTLGELKQRTERMHRFASLEEVAQTIDGLAGRELSVRLERRPGQKEERYAQLLGGAAPDEGPAVEQATEDGSDWIAGIESRLERLESAFEQLSARLDG